MNIFDLIIKDKSLVKPCDVYLSTANELILQQVLKEFQYRDKLLEYGLQVNHKILLHGASGCGKTLLAKSIATALEKNILILNLSNIINARIGETSQNIKQIFEKSIRDKAILFLDEFDQIGKQRVSDENDVGEMRRLVNSVIQQMDYLPQDVLLIAATNHLEIIDDALLRRFQVRMHFELPTQHDLDHFYDNIVKPFPQKWQQVDRRYDISFAEAKDYILTNIKKMLIDELEDRKDNDV